jgi:hypothetical protein
MPIDASNDPFDGGLADDLANAGKGAAASEIIDKGLERAEPSDDLDDAGKGAGGGVDKVDDPFDPGEAGKDDLTKGFGADGDDLDGLGGGEDLGGTVDADDPFDKFGGGDEDGDDTFDKLGDGDDDDVDAGDAADKVDLDFDL